MYAFHRIGPITCIGKSGLSLLLARNVTIMRYTFVDVILSVLWVTEVSHFITVVSSPHTRVKLTTAVDLWVVEAAGGIVHLNKVVIK